MTNTIKQLVNDYHEIPDDHPLKPLVKVSLDSILSHEKNKSSNSNQQLNLRLLPAKHQPGEIDALTLSHTLLNIQKISDNIVASEMGVESVRGPFPTEVTEASELIISATKVGSFVVELKSEESQQLDLFESNNPLDLLANFFVFINKAESVEQILDEYNLRILNPLRSLFENLDAGQAELVIDYPKLQKNVYFTHQQVKKYKTQLDVEIKEVSEEEVEISGVLRKIDLENRLILIKQKDKFIEIKVTDKAFDTSRKLIPNETYSFLVLKNAYNISDQAQKEVYTLYDLDNIQKIDS